MQSLPARSIAILVVLLIVISTTKTTIASSHGNDSHPTRYDFQREFNEATNATSMSMNLSEENRVYHGLRVTDINRVPFIVSLQIMLGRNERHTWEWKLCGAELVAPKYLMTAAHCMFDEDKTNNVYRRVNFVLARVHSLKRGQPRSSGQVIQVAKMYIPRKYNPKKRQVLDVAVLELSENVSEEHRHFATLAHPDEDTDDMTGEIAQVYGWGMTSEAQKISSNLLTGTVTIMSHEDCKLKRKDPTRSEAMESGAQFWLSRRHMCYSGTYEKSCKGDSGGPVIFKNKVVGIISRGSYLCNPITIDTAVRVTSVWDFVNKYARLGLERDMDNNRWNENDETAPNSVGDAYMKELHVYGRS